MTGAERVLAEISVAAARVRAAAQAAGDDKAWWETTALLAEANRCLTAATDAVPIDPVAPSPLFTELQVAGVRLDPVRVQAVLEDGRAVKLSSKEFGVMFRLMSAPQVLWSSDELLAEVWGFTHPRPADRGVVASMLSRLRGKLDRAGLDRRVLVNDPGRGWRFLTPDTVPVAVAA